MNLQRETAADHSAIRTVVVDAFDQTDEADLVEALRAGGDLAISLVAMDGDAVRGHISLSVLKSPDATLALAPVSVAKSCQGRGIGSMLIREALIQARTIGFKMIFVLGDPDYYCRFGFSVETAVDFPCDYAGPHFMALQLTEQSVEVARVEYAQAFSNL
ncbi:MAG: putative acetyltransferase [Alphaproteobacteria bacterium]|jgi:putative acetyltransferase